MCFAHIWRGAGVISVSAIVLTTGIASLLLSSEALAVAAAAAALSGGGVPVAGPPGPVRASRDTVVQCEPLLSQPAPHPSPTPTPSKQPSRTPSPTPSPSPSHTPSPSPSATEPTRSSSASASSSLPARPAQSTTPTVAPTPTATLAVATKGTPQICMAITRSAKSVQPGQAAGFTIRVWTEDWSPAGQVTVTLSGQPSPKFTTIACQRGKTAAEVCTFPVPGLMPAALDAQFPATSKKSPPRHVSVTAAAQLSAPKIKPLLVSQSTPLASLIPTPITAYKTAVLPPGLPGVTLPLGPFPDLTIPATGGSLIGAGSAAGLFPQISPSPAPKHTTASHPALHNATSASPVSQPKLTAQVISLIALVGALLLAGLRLPLRLPRKHG